jgi:hypothetical protein
MLYPLSYEGAASQGTCSGCRRAPGSTDGRRPSQRRPAEREPVQPQPVLDRPGRRRRVARVMCQDIHGDPTDVDAQILTGVLDALRVPAAGPRRSG